MSDARDDARKQRAMPPAILRIVERSKSQTVQCGDRPRAHRENVAQDSANSSRCALKRLDEARMIVRFDLEAGAPIVANIDDAGVFSRRHDDALALRRQSLQMNA